MPGGVRLSDELLPPSSFTTFPASLDKAVIVGGKVLNLWDERHGHLAELLRTGLEARGPR